MGNVQLRPGVDHRDYMWWFEIREREVMHRGECHDVAFASDRFSFQ